MKDGGTTVSEMVVLAVIDPDVPVTMTGYVPAAAESMAEKLIELELVVGLVPNAALTPLGSPLIDKVTLLLNPLTPFTLTHALPLPPWPIVSDDALERVKLGAATTIFIDVEAVRDPLVAVSVTE